MTCRAIAVTAFIKALRGFVRPLNKAYWPMAMIAMELICPTPPPHFARWLTVNTPVEVGRRVFPRPTLNIYIYKIIMDCQWMFQKAHLALFIFGAIRYGAKTERGPIIEIRNRGTSESHLCVFLITELK